MRITNRNGKIITDFGTWRDAFIEVDNEDHWKKGRSAYSLASHFTNPSIEQSGGEKVLLKCMKLFGFENIVFEHAEIEHESRFDAFRGKGRIQDIIIWARNKETQIAICIEAKVDEEFDSYIPDAYKEKKKYVEKKTNSKTLKRLEELCKQYYKDKDIEELKNIRYQLLYYLAGSIAESKKLDDVVFMPIIVYKTDDYDKDKGNENKKDYEQFMKSLRFEQIPNDDRNILLYKKKFEDIIVYSAYIEVEQLSN